jgi:SAM-dependent methyltransferase
VNPSNGIEPHTAPPSAWVQRWSHLVPAAGVVLDVACGSGRHARWFYELNHRLALVDRSQSAIESIAIPAHACEAVVADIETGPWPFAGRQFDAVVVTNYLWRPLMPTLLGSLAPGGVLIYETFTQGNETVGKPASPDFLLRTGELLELCRSLRVVAFEDGFQEDSQGRLPRFIQRIVAVREDGNRAGLTASPNLADARPPRYRLP